MTALLILPFALLLAPTLLILAARLLSESPRGVIDEVMALSDASMADRLAAVSCFRAAREVERRTWLYDATAPQVTAVALLFTRRSADRLPRWARKWDNNVSLNGDGEGVLRDGQWLTRGHDIAWDAPLKPGDRLFRYADPDYGGDAYYARGHHPRSWWARWVWVGWRNRASALSLALGAEVTGRPQCLSGSTEASRERPGHFLLRQGELYHYKSFRNAGPFCVIRSYGYKLEIVRNSQDGTGLAAAVAIGRSLKRRKS